ncbi:MAG: hypothetical protein ACI39R_07635 [Lachnospiraceae bacterium]
MKKKIIISVVAVLILIGIGLTVVLVIHKKNEKVPVVLCQWNNDEAEYTVCEVVGEVSYSNLAGIDTVVFTTDMTMDEIIDSNSKDYVETHKVIYYFKQRDAAIFFNDNNYYYILEIENGIYEAGGLWGNWEEDGFTSADINFPFPNRENFFDGMYETCKELNYDAIGQYFKLFDFEYLKSFYSRLSDDLYDIDEENQIITVKAYGNTNNIVWEGGMKYEIIIDCKEKTITGPSKDGGTITIPSFD